MWPGITKAIDVARRVPWHAFWFAFGSIVASTGVGLGFVAWSSASARMAVWAVVLMLLAPAIAVLGTPGRRECERNDPIDSAEAISRRLRRAEFGLTIIRAARAIVLIAVSFLAILWLCELGDLNSAGGFLLPYTGLCAGSLVVYLPWLVRRERRVMVLSQTRRGQLEAFKRNRDWIPD